MAIAFGNEATPYAHMWMCGFLMLRNQHYSHVGSNELKQSYLGMTKYGTLIEKQSINMLSWHFRSHIYFLMMMLCCINILPISGNSISVER